jgi:hypothetical protein
MGTKEVFEVLIPSEASIPSLSRMMSVDFKIRFVDLVLARKREMWAIRWGRCSAC